MKFSLERTPNQRKPPNVQPLASALQRSLANATNAQPNGPTKPAVSDSHSTTSTVSGQSSLTTTPHEETSCQTGLQHGGHGAVTPWSLPPVTAKEAQERAVALVETSLPPSVQAWLTDSEENELQAASVGRKAISKANITPEALTQTRIALSSLSELMVPARTRGGELELLVGKLFAAFNLYTGDEGKLRAQVIVWVEELEGFPLWAIRIAYKWAVTTSTKMPSLAEFIADVKLAIGSKTLRRKRMLEALLSS